ncbi:MAG: elongation factor P hydroxylase [Shewanellaceae bacterium]|nr:elongation factor P hydroxylase [Shewanellaceae bacterium]
MLHSTTDLIRLFNGYAQSTYNTVLVAGGAEPLYQPSHDPSRPHRIVFRQDYFASALHEIAHWCLAGTERRLLVDYGYWYLADGRNAEQQAQFEAAEIKPQAIESGLSLACGFPFQVSCDNLDGAVGDKSAFTQRVQAQLEQYQQTSFPPRAMALIALFQAFYQPQTKVNDVIRKI